MKPKGKNPNNLLDQAIDVMSTSEPDRPAMEDGAARVWARIGEELSQASPTPPSTVAVEQLRSCDDYRALITDYIAGRLPSARALLFKDHIHECVACRNALNAARGSGPRLAVKTTPRRFNKTAAVLAAAAVLVAGVVLLQSGYLGFLLPAVSVNAMARTIDGKLYRVAGLNMSPVAAGESIKAGEPVRTAAGSRAVIELADGTRVEMRERSQLSLIGVRDGIRVNLDRGSVIVEAAKQRNGHFYVGTNDCTVSVVGTVFAVSSGVKGSRVSVIEGEVHVAQPSEAEQALHPGQQLTTTASLTATPISQEISWSENLDSHLAMLRALADVNTFLHDRVPGPQLRYSSTLLPLLPANTAMYAAFPNLSSTLGQAYDLFNRKINQDARLQTWWATKNQQRDSTDPTLEELIGHVRDLGDQLGDEMVIAVTGTRAGPEDIMVLAAARNPAGVLREINTIAQHTSKQNPLRVLTDPKQLASFKGNEQGPVAFADGSVLVLATSSKAIYDVVSAKQSGSNSFAGRPFYASIAQAYSQGAGTLFAVDLATLFSGAQGSDEARFMGLTGSDRLIVEQKQVGGKTITKAQLNFTGQRSGAAAWLAPPAAMGALEFVSPQAYGIVSIITKDAGAIVDELLSFGGTRRNGLDELQQFERETGVDLRRDLAEPLGGEFLVAMDGPFLPTPSWKLIAEVYDSARLQNTIERLLNQVNIHAAASAQPALTLSSEAAGGQIYYRLRSANGYGPEMHYTFVLGYLVAAPSRALVSQALQYRQSRSSIANSAQFRSLIAADGADYCSAILYQNLTEAANSVANYVPTAVGGISSQQLQSLRKTIELTPATLVCATGEPNRIVMGYQGDLAFNVMMLGGLRNMMQVVGP